MNSLLPARFAEDVRREKILRLVLAWVVLLNIAVAIGIVFMLPSYFFLTFSQDEIIRRLATEEEVLARLDIKSLENRIAYINQLSALFQKNEIRRHALAPIMTTLNNVQEPGVFLNTISLQKRNNGLFALALSGDATRRDSLLAYVKKIKSAAVFLDVNAPISNLLREFKATFSLDIAIKPEVYRYDTP